MSHKKVEQTIKINATAIVCPQPIQLAVNPLKSNLIRNHWCGSKKEIESDFYITPPLKNVSSFWTGDKGKVGVMYSDGTLEFAGAN